MEYCRARRISAAATGDAQNAHAIKSPLTNDLIRMFILPGVARAFFFSMRGRPSLCGSLDLGNAAVPVEDLLAVPVQHTLVLVHIIIDLFEVFDSVRLPADVRVDRQRAEFRAFFAFSI